MQEEFINIARHEMRTPIMPYLGYSELLHKWSQKTSNGRRKERKRK